VLRIGTRGSRLALWQARAVEAAIQEVGGPSCESIIIRTSGDRLATNTLSLSGGKSLFVKEIEEALLNGVVDLAVHSAKDLPADLPQGLMIGATLPRADPRDALVIAKQENVEPSRETAQLMSTLGPKPRIGTGSVRRIAQLSHAFPNVAFQPIRGNVDTRLRKLDEGQYDAIVLASAGLVRLGLASRISASFSASECIPAPGQGIVAIEVRASETANCPLLTKIGDRNAMLALEAERALVKGLNGDCRVPIGAIAVTEADGLVLNAVVASLDGQKVLRRQTHGPAQDASALGHDLANQLLEDGADMILAQHRQ